MEMSNMVLGLQNMQIRADNKMVMSNMVLVLQNENKGFDGNE
jgi:hypothetical protein